MRKKQSISSRNQLSKKSIFMIFVSRMSLWMTTKKRVIWSLIQEKAMKDYFRNGTMKIEKLKR